MTPEQLHTMGFVFLGISVLLLVLLVFADIGALVAHVMIGIGSLLAFPTWGGRALAFVVANVAGIIVGLGLRALVRGGSPKRPTPPAGP